MIADGNVFIVGEKRLIGTEELAYAGGVVDGGVEVGVVGDVDGSAESGTGDGVEGGFGCLPTVGFCVGVKERGEGFAEKRPEAMAERKEWIEDRSLTDFDQGWGEQAGRGAGVEVEEVSADGDAEVEPEACEKGLTPIYTDVTDFQNLNLHPCGDDRKANHA